MPLIIQNVIVFARGNEISGDQKLGGRRITGLAGA